MRREIGAAVQCDLFPDLDRPLHDLPCRLGRLLYRYESLSRKNQKQGSVLRREATLPDLSSILSPSMSSAHTSDFTVSSHSLSTR